MAGLEVLVRPFIPVTSESKPKVRTPPEEETPEAFITWGGPATFSNEDFEEQSQDVGFNVDDDDPEGRERFIYSEEGRRFTDFKVTNPEDPEQYVIVRRIDEISFSGPEGIQVRFVMMRGGSAPGTEEGSGQEPPAPPRLEDI